MTSKICVIPWTHVAIQQNGDARVCCQMVQEPFGRLQLPGNANSCLNVTRNPLDQTRNHIVIKEIRASMIKGEEHPACDLCWKEEANGLTSKRLFINEAPVHGKKMDLEDIVQNTAEDGTIDPEKFPLSYYDLRFGNLCNLRCRYCGPADSSLWYEDWHKLNPGTPHMKNGPGQKTMWFYGNVKYKVEKKDNKYGVFNSDDFEWYEQPLFWEGFEKNIDKLDRLYFTGGEPTINKAHFRMLELVISHGIADRVTLEYNSNMFATPPKLYELWKHFKHVDIGCSIDGIGDMAAYLRPPSKWETLEKNLDQLGFNGSPNIVGSLSTTISLFNVRQFPEICEWLRTKHYDNIRHVPAFHMLHYPAEFSVQVLPAHVKEQITFEYDKFVENEKDPNWQRTYQERLSGIINFMNAEDKSHLLPQLKQQVMQLDELRDMNLRAVIPWLADILDQV